MLRLLPTRRVRSRSWISWLAHPQARRRRSLRSFGLHLQVRYRWLKLTTTCKHLQSFEQCVQIVIRFMFEWTYGCRHVLVTKNDDVAVPTLRIREYSEYFLVGVLRFILVKPEPTAAFCVVLLASTSSFSGFLIQRHVHMYTVMRIKSIARQMFFWEVTTSVWDDILGTVGNRYYSTSYVSYWVINPMTSNYVIDVIISLVPWIVVGFIVWLRATTSFWRRCHRRTGSLWKKSQKINGTKFRPL
jgi:hypothetical protein